MTYQQTNCDLFFFSLYQEDTMQIIERMPEIRNNISQVSDNDHSIPCNATTQLFVQDVMALTFERNVVKIYLAEKEFLDITMSEISASTS